MTKKKQEVLTPLLPDINSVEDLRRLPKEDMPRLAEEIRTFLITHTTEHGGHLASNLGVVELTLALHRVMNTPSDRIIWDVGHQCYIHKMLTGRREEFDTMRKPGGLSGFTKMEESEFDAFGVGHASTSISAALGYAEANAIAGKKDYAVAVIGDGALTGGLAQEGINNCRPDLRLIVILNENEMSISHVTGAFPRLMSKLRISRGYNSIKQGTRSLRRIPILGPLLYYPARWFRNMIRHIFYRSNFFEEMGFTYLGPYDGNDYKQVATAISLAKKRERCVVIHLRTQKGMGHPEAEAHPNEYHCIYPTQKKVKETYHDVFGRFLHKIGGRDEKVCAITPATGETTGMTAFEEAYPKRFFDVGIAEEHAVTFAAGLAAAGMKPYVVIYSSFLQRSYDQMIHDVALQHLPVRLIVDRASLAPADGPTHHGIYDVAFLSQIEGLKIYSPATFGSLKHILKDTKDTDEPIVIRYPNGAPNEDVVGAFYPKEDYEEYGVRATDDCASAKVVVVSYGVAATRAFAAVKTLREEGISAGMVLMETLTPVGDTGAALAKHIPDGAQVIFLEEGIYNGGLAMQIGAYLNHHRPDVLFDALAIRDGAASPKTLTDIYAFHGISADDVVKTARSRQNTEK